MSTQKGLKSIRLKDLTDLGNHFKFTNDNKTIKDTLTLKDNKKLIESSLKHEDKKVKITFHTNFKSVRCKKDRFNNHIKSKSCNESTIIKKLYELEFCECDRKDIPFNLDEETLTIKQRHIRIMNLSGVYNSEKDGEISKATYLDAVTKDLCFGHKTNQPTRIYFKYNNDNIMIMLIDFYHLFATENEQDINRKYKDVSSYNVDITSLRNSKDSGVREVKVPVA